MSNSKQIFRLVAYLPVVASTLPLAATAFSYGVPIQVGSEEHLRDAAWTFHYENVMGTAMEVTIQAPTSPEAERAEDALLASIERHVRVLSAWDRESELSRWLATRGQVRKVSPELFEVLALFDLWRERTGGALDASAETAVLLWRRNAAAGQRATKVEIAQTVEVMQQPHWKLDAAQRTAVHLTDAPLALASFTKSYVAN